MHQQHPENCKCHDHFLIENEIEKHEKIAQAPKRPTSRPLTTNLAIKITTIVLSAVLAVGGATAYVNSGDNAAEKEAITHAESIKKELTEENDEKFVKKAEFSRIDESLKNQKEDIDEIKKEQKDMSKKMDKIFDVIVKE